jgi:pimeloyl-ACP methyl ester carboxylesterase
MPCVIYCHGNSSSRIEAKELVTYLLPENITLFCFDFPGCGQSEGEYISLGHYEKDEINVIVDFLRSARKVSTVALWGRSMGAATSLLHANWDPSIAALVLDSPFADLKQLVTELGKTRTKLPDFLLSAALSLVRKSV